MSSPPGADALDPEERRRWTAYIDLHETGRRAEALAELEAVVDAVASYEPQQRAAFVDSVCAAWTDSVDPPGHLPSLLRYPLVRDVLLPHLLSDLAEAGLPDELPFC